MKISSDLHRSHGVSDRRLGGGQVAPLAPPPPGGTPLSETVASAVGTSVSFLLTVNARCITWIIYI